MSFENNISQFNIESFKNEFLPIVKKYTSAVDELDHIGNVTNFSEDDELGQIEKGRKEELEPKVIIYMDQLVNASVKALKSANNKQEVLDTIYLAFRQREADNDDCIQRIILELLRTQK